MVRDAPAANEFRRKAGARAAFAQQSNSEFDCCAKAARAPALRRNSFAAGASLTMEAAQRFLSRGHGAQRTDGESRHRSGPRNQPAATAARPLRHARLI